MSSNEVTFVVGAEPPARLDKALARDVPEAAALSRTRLARLIDEGAVTVNGAVARDVKARVAEGDAVIITVAPPVPLALTPEAIPLDIRYEDTDLLVVNKAAGMVVHPAPGAETGTLVHALLAHCGGDLAGVGGVKRPGIVHRIDKETSGLLVVAKSDAAHAGLSAQFAAHTVARRYLAFCYGVPDAGDPRLRGVPGVSFEPGVTMKITTQLARHKNDRQRQAVLFHGGRHAVTRVQMRESYGGVVAQIACRLETGRTHQIRVHLAHVGHGLIGDPTYGGRRKLKSSALSAIAHAAIKAFPRQALHAAELGFLHPTRGDVMRFEATLPPDMTELEAALRSDARHSAP